MMGNIGSSSRNSLSQASSSTFSNTLVLRPSKGEAKRVDMQISDIIDLEIRDKVAAMLPSYPSYSLLYLTYVLVRRNGKSDAARDLLHDTRHNRDQYLPITYITSLKEIGDVTMRDKVEGIIKMVPEVTIWWAFYALQICDGSVDHAIGLLFEGVVDASRDPAIQVALASSRRVSPAISPMSRPDESLFIDSSSDFDSSFFSDTNGNESSKPTLSSPELLQQTLNKLFVDTSDDDKDPKLEEEDTTLRASPDYSNLQKPPIDKGKGVDKSDPKDPNSDFEMSNIPPFKESPRFKRHEEQNRTCKFCGTVLKSWLARTSHEKSCRMKTKSICVKCKREVSKSNIRRHEASCDGRQTSRCDGPEYEVRGSTIVTASRDNSPDFDSSDSYTEDQLQKVKEMQLFLPRLSSDKCIDSLALCDYNVKEAVNLEREALTSDEEVDDRGSYRRKNDSGKRGSGSTSVERVTKKARIQIGDRDTNLEPASQWIETTFSDLCQNSANLTIVNLSDSKSRSVPTKLLCDNSESLKNLIDLTGDEDVPKEILLLDIESHSFDALIQYMACRNVSFGSRGSQTQKITSIVNFILLADDLKVAGPATTMLPVLESLLKEERKGPFPSTILKGDHVERVFSTLGASHPISKLFVRASIRPFLCHKIGNTSIEEEFDDDSQFTPGDIEIYRNKPAHLAFRLNNDFKSALLLKVFETTSTREYRQEYTRSKTPKKPTTWFTDPLDDSQFTI
ncbi:uncharacterized protein EAE97_002902 [Botrytis byssoidea]|uniref:Uncharacterized protein n=1 Tax=Botrytis byssoidea TaxID=139641 RepID=A0A9P5IS35_9HELO|nr:uncharacterized protein EAE97_002902 [Botrytis byssoidea]KAF7949393.1 hypothetical protein EAE97_002902 [Botrytis byssoidea]